MKADSLYHLFNRGNQRQPIFFQERNYYFFLEKIKKTFVNDIDLLAYCLMPNHFHLLAITSDAFDPSSFSSRLKTMLSSYTQALQKQQHFVGSLFQQNTKKKELPDFQDAFNCFQYIHQNPLKAKLVKQMEHWPHSSFKEYFNSKPKICNVSLGRKLLDLSPNPGEFYTQSINLIN